MEKVKFKIIEEYGMKYLVDKDNNRVNLEIFGIDIATEMLDSLENCSDCNNCVNCYNCVDCSNCKDCENLIFEFGKVNKKVL